MARRDEARRELGIRDEQFVLLLVGNDWRKKGLSTLLDVLTVLDRQVLLLVVGDDEKFPYLRQIQRYDLVDRVRFLPSRPDVAFYYAAADAYVEPSVEDTFAQLPAEAMACGLAVITSVTNGTAEIITDGMDGLIIQDPYNSPELATQIRRLCEDPYFCRWLGENAACTSLRYTWDRNCEQMKEIFTNMLRNKKVRAATAI
jgi:glycosyltransferase involved in cell wall biosynthesis